MSDIQQAIREKYGAMWLVGFAVGLPLSAAGAYLLYLYRFDPVAVKLAAYYPAPGSIICASCLFSDSRSRSRSKIPPQFIEALEGPME